MRDPNRHWRTIQRFGEIAKFVTIACVSVLAAIVLLDVLNKFGAFLGLFVLFAVAVYAVLYYLEG